MEKPSTAWNEIQPGESRALRRFELQPPAKTDTLPKIVRQVQLADPPALDPRRRKLRERFDRPARAAAGCLRQAVRGASGKLAVRVMRSQTRRVPQRFWQAAGALRVGRSFCDGRIDEG